ncbi:gas vesicle protein [Streptomyces exfoliatus]|uniref:gas vesicle protein n=1 Tax=Streptomyces exfoliatus TaxID=1905 RepID=UPI003C304CDE
MSAYEEAPISQRQVALVDLLDRLLSGGVVLTGDLVLTIADVELVRISLNAVIVAVRGDEGAFGSLLPGASDVWEGATGERPG